MAVKKYLVFLIILLCAFKLFSEEKHLFFVLHSNKEYTYYFFDTKENDFKEIKLSGLDKKCSLFYDCQSNYIYVKSLKISPSIFTIDSKNKKFVVKEKIPKHLFSSPDYDLPMFRSLATCYLPNPDKTIFIVTDYKKDNNKPVFYMFFKDNENKIVQEWQIDNKILQSIHWLSARDILITYNDICYEILNWRSGEIKKYDRIFKGLVTYHSNQFFYMTCKNNENVFLWDQEKGKVIQTYPYI